MLDSASLRPSRVSRTPGRAAGPCRGVPARRPTKDPPWAAQDTDGAGRTKVRRLGSAPSRARDTSVQRQHPRRGQRGGEGVQTPQARRRRPPHPHSAPQAPKREVGGGGRSGISRPTPLGCSPQGWYLRGSFHLRRYIPALALSLVIAPKGRSCPFKRQRAAATHPPSGNYARGGEVGFPADSFPVPLRAPAAPLSALPSSAKPGRGREGWTGAAPLRGAASPPPGWGQGAGTGPLRPAAGTSGRAPRRPGCAPGGGGGAAPARVLTAPTGCPRPRRWLRPARHSPWLAGSARARAPTRIPRRRRR